MVRAMSLRLQLLLLQAAIVCVVTVAAGTVAVGLQERTVRDAHRERMVGVALSIARLPAIVDAFDTDDPSATIQPIAEVIREASDLAYVVVTDADGIRLSHPNPDRIGEAVSTDPSIPLSGTLWSGTETGTLGESYRVKAPVFRGGADQGDDEGAEVIGSVSVGVLESELAADLQSRLPWLMLAFGGAALAGVFGAAWVASLIRRRILGLEPEQIAELVDERETMLHRLSEGVVRVNRDGVVSSANDAAARLLGEDDLVGRAAAEVFDGPLLDVLEQGEPEGRLVLAGERALIARATGLRDDAGRPVEGTLLLRDHTELHSALRDMDGQQSLTDGLRAQAHEFANSMHVVSGLLELEAWDDARDFIAHVQPGGALALGPTDQHVGPELAALLSVKLARARELGITLSVTSTASVPASLSSDLVTIVGNLVDNAFDACGPGDRVDVRLVVRGGSDQPGGDGAGDGADDGSGDGIVEVVVEDSGPGIADTVADSLFESGVSTKDASARTRGIGLALVRRVARRRGGKVSVSRGAAGGARFDVTLPVEVSAR